MKESEERKLRLISSMEQLKAWATMEWEFMSIAQREVFIDALLDETHIKNKIDKRVAYLARMSVFQLELEYSHGMETVLRDVEKSKEQEISDLISKDLCPECGSPVVITRPHMMVSKILCDVDCKLCSFRIRNGIWNKDEGYCGEQRNM